MRVFSLLSSFVALRGLPLLLMSSGAAGRLSFPGGGSAAEQYQAALKGIPSPAVNSITTPWGEEAFSTAMMECSKTESDPRQITPDHTRNFFRSAFGKHMCAMLQSRGLIITRAAEMLKPVLVAQAQLSSSPSPEDQQKLQELIKQVAADSLQAYREAKYAENLQTGLMQEKKPRTALLDLHQSSLSSSTPTPGVLPQGMDDEQLKRLGLGLLHRASTPVAPADAIYTDPTTGASVYCGCLTAASSLDELGRRNIRRVVNCQEPDSENFFAGQEVVARNASFYPALSSSHENSSSSSVFQIEYLHFHINGLSAQERALPQQKEDAQRETVKIIWSEFSNFFQFVDEGLKRGESSLIHCAAGMHRAGGASVAYLMHKHKLSFAQALKIAQSKRAVIDPYHKELLNTLGKIQQAFGYGAGVAGVVPSV